MDNYAKARLESIHSQTYDYLLERFLEEEKKKKMMSKKLFPYIKRQTPRDLTVRQLVHAFDLIPGNKEQAYGELFRRIMEDVDPATQQFYTPFTKYAHRYAHHDRYSNIKTNALHRVKVTPWKELDTDYINASWVSNSEIVGQAPPHSAMSQFWKMVYEYGDNIVMLTPLYEQGKIKADQYWPFTDDQNPEPTLDFGDLKVTLLEEENYGFMKHLVIRRLLITPKDSNRSPREVYHFHYTAWPDHGTPENIEDLKRLIDICINNNKEPDQETKEKEDKNIKTTIVHCSAGIGRSIMFTLGLWLRRRVLQLPQVPLTVFEVKEKMQVLRSRRPGAFNRDLVHGMFAFHMAYTLENTNQD